MSAAARALRAALLTLSLACGTSVPAAGPCLEGEARIDHSLDLPAECTHRATLRIVASNVTLDCHGGVVDASGRSHGIVVGGGPGVHSVTVRNCHVLHGQTGIYVGWLGSDTRKAAEYSREALYARTPQQVRIESSSVRNSERVGIFIDDYASHVTVSRAEVSGCGSAGIYLEHSSRHNTVEYSSIVGNGYGRFPLLRWGMSRREGIAIDSSAHNRVIANRIAGNAAGAVFLYKNCHEHSSTDPDSPPRWQHANHNVIALNTIEDESVGVWLASRQSRDLDGWDCGDPAYWGNSLYPDYARHNIVENNRFVRVRRGVVIEDDNNAVVGNTFSATDEPIVVGARRRAEVLGHAVEGTVIRDNAVERAQPRRGGRPRGPRAGGRPSTARHPDTALAGPAMRRHLAPQHLTLLIETVSLWE